jgi:3' exoribonuclease, RNase T-like
MNQAHYMIDLETMDTAPTAVIASIGAVRFTVEDGIVDRLTLMPMWDVGTYSPKTVKWWLGQSQEARAAITGPAPQYLTTSLQALLGFVGKDDEATVWCNWLDFDMPIINDKLDTYNFVRWNRFRNRCFGTIKKMFPVEYTFKGVEHDALQDAENHALHLLAIGSKYRFKVQ